MEQTKALNALEPFLALTKSATSPRAASDLVTQATSAPNTYVFAELLQTPNIQNLRSSEEYAPYLALLEIFAWGTWEDYKGTFSMDRCSASSHFLPTASELIWFSTTKPPQALRTTTPEAPAPLLASTLELSHKPHVQASPCRTRPAHYTSAGGTDHNGHLQRPHHCYT
jgi:hypothetical protein